MLRRQGIWNEQVHDFTTSTQTEWTENKKKERREETKSRKQSSAAGKLELLWAFFFFLSLKKYKGGFFLTKPTGSIFYCFWRFITTEKLMQQQQETNEVLRRRKTDLLKMVLIGFCIFRHSWLPPSRPLTSSPTLFIRISITPAIMSEVEEGGGASILCSPRQLPAVANGGKKTKKETLVRGRLAWRVQIIFSRLHCAVHGEEDVDCRGRCSKCCLLRWFY